MSFAQARQHLRQQKGSDGRDNAEPQRSRQGLPVTAGDLHQRFHITDTQSRLGGHLAAELTHRDLAVGAIYQPHPEPGLELPDGDAESRLGHEAGLGRLAEMLMLLQGDEVTELFDGRKVHGTAARGLQR